MFRRIPAVLGLLAALVVINPSAAVAGGFPYDAQNPGTGNTCNDGAFDMPDTTVPLPVNGVDYGTFVVRSGGDSCGVGRWAEIRFNQALGYKIEVSVHRESDGAGDDYAVFDNAAGVQSPVFTSLFNGAGACTDYAGQVLDPDTSVVLAWASSRICDDVDGQSSTVTSGQSASAPVEIGPSYVASGGHKKHRHHKKHRRHKHHKKHHCSCS